MTSEYLCEPAELEWQADVPFSPHYDDIYWHRDGGLEEKQQVFVEPVRSMLAGATHGGQFTICELGFGFGLNCLLTSDLWSTLPGDCWLNFVSIEKHPVPGHLLERFLDNLQLGHSSALLDQYPAPFRGQHVIWLAKNIRLLLIFDDVESALSGLDADVDCWFLDGFAPSRNDAMWQTARFRQMFARSRPGARVATYSAAGHVKRGLDAAGFSTEKKPGFGRKKEMLCATRPGNWAMAEHQQSEVCIVGAGLAGLYCAEALNRRNFPIRLIDDDAVGASSIPQLTVKPHLALRAEAKYRFSLAAHQYMQTSPGYHASGVLWSGKDSTERERIKKIAALFPDDFLETCTDGARFHDAGWLSVNALRSATAQPVTQDRITGISRTPNGWMLAGEKENYQAGTVILAMGSNRHLLHESLQVRAIHGQAISIGTENVSEVSNGKVTVFPTHQGRSVVSGTYARRDDLVIDPKDTGQLVRSAKAVVGFDETDVQTFSGIRAVTRDRLPVAGPVPHWESLTKNHQQASARDVLQGLYYCTAFGSRGATHARLCAEHLVSKILKEPAALDLKQQQMLSPARFYLRDN